MLSGLKAAFPATYRYWQKNPRQIAGRIAACAGVVIGCAAVLLLVEVWFRPTGLPWTQDLRFWLEMTGGPGAGRLAPIINIVGATATVGCLVLAIGFVLRIIDPKAPVPEAPYIQVPHSTHDGTPDVGGD